MGIDPVGSGGSRPKRVLLAEDDDATRKVMASALSNLGIDVVETRDGGRMLVAIASQYKNGHVPEEIDLIVTDVCMPVVSGLELFKSLRAAGWTIPVIIVTGHDTRDVHETAARLDAVLLLKPLDLDELEAAVRAALARPRSPGRAKHA